MKYNVGMYGGSFNPLHNGHVDCIFQAASRCKILYLVLSVGVNRHEIDARIRYRWLYQLTKHLDNVKIIMLEDACPTKEDYTEDLWQADAAQIKSQIGSPIDAVFCGSDYGMGSIWQVCYPASEIVTFPRGEISSTELRQNPYAHWEWLPTMVRPHYVKKVLLMGGESTGKSTLTVHLAHRYSTNYIDESGREISERSGTDLLMLPADFTEILLQHKLNEIKAAASSNKLLFVDTDALVTQFYLEFLEGGETSKNIALSEAIDALNEYSLILFLEPDVAFVQDGGRSELIRRDRIRYSKQIKELLKRHGREFVCLSGDYHTRYLAAVSHVDRLLAGN